MDISYDPSRPLFSLHVAKTGGTSLEAVLQNWFGDGFVRFDGERRDPGPIPSVGAGSCVHGHFRNSPGSAVPHPYTRRVRRYFPDASQFICMLREPYDRFVSHWLFLHFQMERGLEKPVIEGKTFADWLSYCQERVLLGDNHNRFIDYLCVDTLNLGSEDVFGRYLAVGVLERYAESLELLARVLGKPAVDALPKLNVSDRRKEEFEPWRALHADLFPDEYIIYRAATRRLDALLAANGVEATGGV